MAEDIVMLHAEDDGSFAALDNIDLEDIKAAVEEEERELQAIEMQLRNRKQEEVTRRRKKVMEGLEALQAIKDKKAKLRLELAGKTSSLPCSPATLPVRMGTRAATPGVLLKQRG